MFLGTFDVLGLQLSACDHEFILNEIDGHIKKKKKFLISPLASQTFILTRYDKRLKTILGQYDYLFSDSLWVKRAVNYLYNIGLRDRLRGSNFLLQTSALAAKKRYKIYLYGTTADTLLKLKLNLLKQFPNLNIVGFYPSVFRSLTKGEKQDLIHEVESKKTDILFLALGSPLEQIFAYDLLFTKPKLSKPLVIIPFGAAFDFTAGTKAVAPIFMQKWGIEWFFRLLSEPRRLWKRYLVYGPIFIILVLSQKISLLFNPGNYKIIKAKRRS